MNVALVLSCEHADNRVPARFSALFDAEPGVLETHEAFDLGAGPLARRMSRELGAPYVEQSLCRLLIDSNRSETNHKLFSRFSRHLSDQEKARLVSRYRRHRSRVQELIEGRLKRGGRVIHVAVHSFTPCLGETLRVGELGILYDPARLGERRFAERWQASLRRALPHLRTRRNYPYRGASDGLTTALRRCFDEEGYWGFEIEINQALLARRTVNQRAPMEAVLEVGQGELPPPGARFSRQLCDALCATLGEEVKASRFSRA